MIALWDVRKLPDLWEKEEEKNNSAKVHMENRSVFYGKLLLNFHHELEIRLNLESVEVEQESPGGDFLNDAFNILI